MFDCSDRVNQYGLVSPLKRAKRKGETIPGMALTANRNPGVNAGLSFASRRDAVRIAPFFNTGLRGVSTMESHRDG